jgi:hypothetical protein
MTLDNVAFTQQAVSSVPFRVNNSNQDTKSRMPTPSLDFRNEYNKNYILYWNNVGLELNQRYTPWLSKGCQLLLLGHLLVREP